MAKNLEQKTADVRCDPARHLRWVEEMDRLVKVAVKHAQEENRRLGIPNYYEINGRIVSDQPEQPEQEEPQLEHES